MNCFSSRSFFSLKLVRFIGALIVLLAVTRVSAESVVRDRIDFNAGWRFLKSDDANWTAAQLDYAVTKSFLLAASGDLLGPLTPKPARPVGNVGGEIAQVQMGFDDSSWRLLDLPHDWGIEGPFRQELPGETGKLPWAGTAWYRKTFRMPATDVARRISLEIDGAMAFSTVWVNGHLAGGWPYGYTSYAVDLTPFLRFDGDNIIAVRLDNPPNSSRWYPGGGIYRNVWLVKTGKVFIPRNSVVVTTPRVSSESAVVSVDVVVGNAGGLPADVSIDTELAPWGAADQPGLRARSTSGPLSRKVPASGEVAGTQVFTLNAPRLWSLHHPQRYVAITTVRSGEIVLDRFETPFGIRSAVFDADRGFLLNGERVAIQGVCLHHDLGALGTAINHRALERQLQLLAAMGCNAIRTSHNPPAPELLDLCDQLGFLVMDEVFDCWTKGKTRQDYHNLFADWYERDLRAFIRRDRNHPSVVLWSIGNEVQDQHEAEGWKIGAQLAAILREEDRTRPVTSALDGIESPYHGLQHVQDVIGYNYKPWEYVRLHKAFPTTPIFGSETASTISSRGEYFFPLGDKPTDRGSHVDFQVSSYDLSAEAWATTPEAEWAGQGVGDFVAGEFVWTGFDYLGEPTPFLLDAVEPLTFTDPAQGARATEELKQTGKITVPSRSSYFGILDLAGFPKDRYYLYQARWRPELPMVHILPHWTWPERVGAVTPVHVYTSGDEAELFLNGVSLGRKHKAAGASRLRWDEVHYQPGELKVVAYLRGKPWAEAQVRTADTAAKIELSPDRATVTADGSDLAYVSVAIVDRDGTLVPRAKNLVHFTVTGPASIAGVDNGDATSHEPFQASQHQAYNGRALVILKTQAGKPGEITLRGDSDGLAPASTTVRSQ
jgi:beta-galactosidase